MDVKFTSVIFSEHELAQVRCAKKTFQRLKHEREEGRLGMGRRKKSGSEGGSSCSPAFCGRSRSIRLCPYELEGCRLPLARHLMPNSGLSERVKKEGLSAFTETDFRFVVDTVSRSPRRLILVGGQALEVWGVVLDVPPPEGTYEVEDHFHALTVDADWLGQKEDAKWLCEALGTDHTELRIPSPNDPTPSTAAVYLEREGRVMLMDFLSNITGIQNDIVKKFAAEIPIDVPCEESAILCVLDPIHCLLSRMANLKNYSAKRQKNGILQAEWAINIVHEYLRDLIRRGAGEGTINAQCRRIAEIAEYGAKAAEFCFTQYNIDPLSSISDDISEAGGAKFAKQEWPRTVARIREKQSNWTQKYERTQAGLFQRTNGKG